MVVLAVGAAGIWTAIDRERRDYRPLHSGLRTFLRYSLALAMWSYGWAKLVGNQFLPGFQTEILLTPLGQLSKGSMLWESIGYSFPYEFFSGFGEVLGAALLLWRRTATLGALIIIMVMANVVAVDIPAHILAVGSAWNFMMMAVFIAAPDAQRLSNLYIHNRRVAPAWQESTLFTGKWRSLVKGTIIVAMLFRAFIPQPPSSGHYGVRPVRHPMTGVYDVENFIFKGDTIPALVGDSTRWSRVVIGNEFPWPGVIRLLRSNEKPRVIQAARMNGSWLALEIELDTVQHQLTLAAPPPPKVPPGGAIRQSRLGILDYNWVDNTHLELDGVLSGERVKIRLHRLYDNASVFWGGRGYFAAERSSQR
jgi:hypothetical protein